jgi:hypothetical protein
MSIKLTNTQIAMLSAAAQRDDRCFIAPRNLKGGAAQKVAAKLIAGGLAKEINAKPGAPVWRQDQQAGQSFALKLTAAGLRAIPIEDQSASDDTRADGGERVQGLPQLVRRSSGRLLSKLRQRNPGDLPRREMERSWRSSSNCFSAIKARPSPSLSRQRTGSGIPRALPSRDCVNAAMRWRLTDRTRSEDRRTEHGWARSSPLEVGRLKATIRWRSPLSQHRRTLGARRNCQRSRPRDVIRTAFWRRCRKSLSPAIVPPSCNASCDCLESR